MGLSVMGDPRVVSHRRRLGRRDLRTVGWCVSNPGRPPWGGASPRGMIRIVRREGSRERGTMRYSCSRSSASERLPARAPLCSGLARRPLTAVARVQIPLGSPNSLSTPKAWERVFYFCHRVEKLDATTIRTTGISAAAFNPPKVKFTKMIPATAPPRAPERFIKVSLNP